MMIQMNSNKIKLYLVYVFMLTVVLGLTFIACVHGEIPEPPNNGFDIVVDSGAVDTIIRDVIIPI